MSPITFNAFGEGFLPGQVHVNTTTPIQHALGHRWADQPACVREPSYRKRKLDSIKEHNENIRFL